MKLLLIFGTAHSVQMGSPEKDTEEDCMFRAEVGKACTQNEVSLIAEEMSNEALERAGIPKTIGQLIASEQGIEHLLCDPPSKLRSKLGIRDTQAIELDALLEKRTEEKRDQELKHSWSLREDYMLHCIQSVETEKALLICGANHVREFARKAEALNIKTRVVHEDWAPNNGFNSDADKTGAG